MGDVLLLLHPISSACKECNLALKHPQICPCTVARDSSICGIYLCLYDFVPLLFEGMSCPSCGAHQHQARVGNVVLAFLSVLLRLRGSCDSSGNRICKPHMEIHHTKSIVSYLCYSTAEILYSTVFYLILLAANIFGEEYLIKI